MNAADQAAGQLADDRKSSTAPDGFRCRPIVRNLALYDVARKHQLHTQFWMPRVELCMSCHIGQQLGYYQRKLPASLPFEPQIICGKQDTDPQAVQSVFRDGEAKLLEVRRGIGEAPLLWHMQSPMDISPLMQEVYDVEQRGLDLHAIRLHRFD
jgi:hypothetical protein